MRHISDEVRAAVRRANDTDTVIDHATAKAVASAFEWGWSSVWFADTGNFAYPRTFKASADVSAVDAMDHALFGWWWEAPVDPEDSQIRTAMRAYLEERYLTDGGADVDGWAALPTL